MSECICSSCRNLKGIIGENGDIEEYDCEFGYPSEECEDCGAEGCDLTCGHYISDEIENEPRIAKCKGCGRDLSQICDEPGDGDVYCIDCYLKQK